MQYLVLHLLSILIATDTTRKGYIRDVHGLKTLRSKRLIDVAALLSEAVADDATYLNHQKLLAPVVEEQLPSAVGVGAIAAIDYAAD